MSSPHTGSSSCRAESSSSVRSLDQILAAEIAARRKLASNH
jgi:hypothetical protein